MLLVVVWQAKGYCKASVIVIKHDLRFADNGLTPITDIIN